MYCESCGSFIRDGQTYCSMCGKEAPFIPEIGTAAQALQTDEPVQAVKIPIEQAQLVQSAQSAQPVQPAQPIQQGYQQPSAEQISGHNTVLIPVPPKSVVNYTARAGLILGIVAMVSFYIPYTNIVPAILGIIFSLLGMKKTKELGGKGNCIAGLVLSCAGMLLWLLLVITTIIRNVNG